MPDRPTPSHLTSHLGYWLRYVSNHVSHAFARKIEGEGVTVAEWAVLRALYEEIDIAPSRLAAQMGLSRGAVSKLADRLLTKGLILRRGNADDRRARTLALTDDGRALVPRLSALADLNDAEFFGHLSPAERGVIEQAMRGVVERRGLKTIPIS